MKVLKDFGNEKSSNYWADLATEWEGHLTTGKREPGGTKLDFRCPICRSAISQLFDLRTPSSTDVPVLLLNQPNWYYCHLLNISLS